MGITRLEFILFYSVFLVVVIFLSGLAGQSIISGPLGEQGLPQPTGAWWLDWTLPFTYFFSFLAVSSEMQMFFTIMIMPFLIGIIVIIAEMIRGN